MQTSSSGSNAQLVNTATVSSAGDTNAANNTATDSDNYLGQISGFKFLDDGVFGTIPADAANGVWDQADGETAVPNWLIDLQQNGTTVATATTDANGQYIFNGLQPGTYTVVEDPSNFFAIPGDSLQTTAPLAAFTVVFGTNSQNNNIGNLELFQAPFALPPCMDAGTTRSEERRVGKECRSRWSP